MTHEEQHDPTTTDHHRDDDDPGRQPSSAELERELEETRVRIDRRARELQDSLSPGHLLDSVLGRVRNGGLAEFFGNLGRTARDHPMPIVLTSVGIAWLAASSPHDELDGEWDSEDPDEESALHRGLSSAKEGLHETAERARGAVHRAGESLRSARQGVGHTSAKVGRIASRRGQQLRHNWDRVLEDQPLLLGLFGVAAGAALGFALPASEKEHAWLGEASDELKTKVARKAREGVEQVRERAEELLDKEPTASSTSHQAGSPRSNPSAH